MGLESANDGTAFDPANCVLSFEYDSDGYLISMSATRENGNVYTRTITNDASGNITNISKWILQE